MGVVLGYSLLFHKVSKLMESFYFSIYMYILYVEVPCLNFDIWKSVTAVEP